MILASSTREAIARLVTAVQDSPRLRVLRNAAVAIAKVSHTGSTMPLKRDAVEEAMSIYVEANRTGAEPFAKAYHRLLESGDEFLTLAYEEAQIAAPTRLDVAKRAELRATIEAEIEKRALCLLSDDRTVHTRKRHPAMSLQQAIASVLASDPELYDAYDALGPQ